MHTITQSVRRFSSVTLISTALMSGVATADNAIAQRHGVETARHELVATLSNTPETEIPRIQLAILLDTSNSMDGLIDQTRNQLWQVVNEFASAKKNGVSPILEIALLEYGNSGLSRSTGYIRKLSGFTRELDKVSEELFSLTTNGGDEYCGYVIKSAIEQLQWSQSDRDVKSIFIAGNESFAQGPVDFREAARAAVESGIAINTIHAGDHQQGIDGNWQTGALLAQGSYMSIDANRKVVHVEAPQDKKIAVLNARLNQTYLPYGEQGASKARRQMEQDAQSSSISSALLAKRAKSKSSSFYNNAGWDLVDAMNEGQVDEKGLVEMEEASLPETMKGLSSGEKLGYVREKAQERARIKQEIDSLSKSRAAFVAEARRKQVAAPSSMGDALSKAIKQQAEQKQFEFEKGE
jgi:hypothetical protein